MNTPENTLSIAVIGAGTIGASWAALYLARGFEVKVHDPIPAATAQVRDYIEQAWPMLQAMGVAGAAPDFTRLQICDSIEAAVADVDLVQENAPENLKIKTPLLVAIDAALPADRIIASSSSGLTLDELRQNLAHPERMLIGHPFNPPHLIPLVEVVADEQSSSAARDWLMDFYRRIDKAPIHLRRSVPGHVANRLQAAVWREAIHLVNEGVASVADVDLAMATGPGIRWAILGPTATFHLGGGPEGVGALVDKLGPAFESWWHDLGTFTEFTPEMKQKLVDGVKDLPEWGALREARNEKLVELLKVLPLDLETARKS